jgi:hypothetical protein
MLVHAVYIWLNDDLSAETRAKHLDALRALKAIPFVRQFHLGVPASTDRPVIERSYTYALVVACDDLAGLEAYRAHPVHDALRDIAATCWKKQIVFDSIEVN